MGITSVVSWFSTTTAKIVPLENLQLYSTCIYIVQLRKVSYPNVSTSVYIYSKATHSLTPICLRACFLCTSVSAWMRSANPSTSVRSSFPLKNALFVKSPGSACLQPGTLLRALRTARTTAGPPWVWNSTESSPVKLWGPVSSYGKHWKWVEEKGRELLVVHLIFYTICVSCAKLHKVLWTKKETILCVCGGGGGHFQVMHINFCTCSSYQETTVQERGL